MEVPMSITTNTILAVEHALRHALEAVRVVRKKAYPSAPWSKVMPSVLEELRSDLRALAEPEEYVAVSQPKRTRTRRGQAPEEPPPAEIVDTE